MDELTISHHPIFLRKTYLKADIGIGTPVTGRKIGSKTRGECFRTISPAEKNAPCVGWAMFFYA
jgi:hypothetical protein